MSEPAAVPTPLTAARRLLIAAVAIVPTALLAVWWATSAPDARLEPLSRLLYWSMPPVIVFAVVAAVMRWRGRTTSIAVQLRQLGPGAVLAIALTALVFRAPPQMRQQFDETCLVGVSQNMHFQRAALITTAALPSHGEVIPLENLVDKRPPLFSFLVSLAHDLTGCRVENAFAVNELLLAVGLFLVFVLVRARLGVLAAVLAPMLVVLFVPLTGTVATSAGFELLATVTMLATVIAAIDFVRTPDAPRWAGLLGCGLLFAQSRYESLAAFVLLLGVVMLAVRPRCRLTFGGWLLFAVGIVLVSPLGCLLLHAQNPKFYPEAGGRPLVAMRYLFEHAMALGKAWFWSPTPMLVGSLAYLAVLGVASWIPRRRTAVAAVVATPVLVVTLVALLWFYGDVDEPTAQRLFLPFAWATALAPLLLVARWRSRKAAVALLLGLGLVVMTSGSTGSDRGATFRIARIVRAVDELADQQPGDLGTTLWVGTTAQSLIVHGRAAMTAAAFERRQLDVRALVQQGDIRTIYVVETPIDMAMAPEHGSPKELLQHFPGDAVARRDDDAIMVYRLRL